MDGQIVITPYVCEFMVPHGSQPSKQNHFTVKIKGGSKVYHLITK